jgi:iron complex transport system permease protein
MKRGQDPVFSGRKRRLYIRAAIICAAALALAAGASLAFGSRPVTPGDITAAFSRGEARSIEEAVVRKRIPRTAAGLVAGAALGMSGALMQAITRNPLADPGILGVNAGAAFFVVAGMAFLGAARIEQFIWLALAGAALSAVLVYAAGSLGYGGATPVKLALSGAAFTALWSSLTSAVLLPRESVLDAFRFWQVGGIGGVTWKSLFTTAPFLITGAAAGLLSAPALNILALGDDTAAGLGVRAGRVRLTGALAGVLLCGAATAFAGPIGFVGLMVPHAVRLISGPEQRVIIPLSAAGGAFILLVSDVIGRLLGRPGELEAGIVTAFIGAPALIAIAKKSKVRAL